MLRCKENNTRGISIFIQVSVIYIFLTLFFFLYSDNVEKQKLTDKLNIIIDDIVRDFPDIDNDTIINVINETLDVTKNNVYDTNQNHNNTNIFKRSMITLIIVTGLIILVLGISRMFGYCVPIFSNIKEVMLILIVIAFTEVLFLHLITTRYVYIDQNDVRKHLSESMKKYVKQSN